MIELCQTKKKRKSKKNGDESAMILEVRDDILSGDSDKEKL